jgi:hypothetical protein
MVPHVASWERETRGLLEALFPTALAAHEYVEARWKSHGHESMRREFFANPQEILRFASKLRNSHDVYFGVAARHGMVGTKEGVKRLQAIWGDLDTKATHTRESRFKQFTNLPHLPSVVVWTGGGYHVYWLLEEPGEGQQELALAESVMGRLAEGLDGDHVGDRARILRLPGSLNHKYPQPRPVELVHCDSDKRYTLEQLREMAEALPEGKLENGRGRVRRDVLGEPIREKRNVVLTSVAGSLRDRGLDEDTIHVALLEVNRLRCEPPLEDAEVKRIAESVSRYPAGSPRYGRSLARRIYPKTEVR